MTEKLDITANKAWLDSWTKGPWTLEPEALEWLKTRPAPVKRLMLLFPPSCVVVATHPVCIPAPGSSSW